MNFTMIPLALALLGPGNQATSENLSIQNETKGCVAMVSTATLQPVSILCDEESGLLLNPENSSQILTEFIRQNNIETIESVHTSWTEGK
jgi:hypothetical protein